MDEMGLRWTDDEIDLVFDADPLESAIIISLFSDGRVETEELPQGEDNRRGYWGDGLASGQTTGSRLWLVQREKSTPEALRLWEDYAREGLAWIEGVDVRAFYDDERSLKLVIFGNGNRLTMGGERGL